MITVFNFGFIKKLRDEIEDNVFKFSREIEQKKQAKEKLLRQPSPKSDVINMLDKFIDEQSSLYENRLSHMLKRYIENPGSLTHQNGGLKHNFLRLLSFTGKDPGISTDPLHDAQPNLFFIFGPQIKESIKRSINDMEWPEAGLSISDRAKEVDKLSADIKALEAKLADVLKDARESGLDI